MTGMGRIDSGAQMEEAQAVRAQAGREIERLRAEGEMLREANRKLDALNRETVKSNNRMFDALDEVREYFDQRADAEYFTDSDSPKGNEEMSMLAVIDAARQQ